MNEEKDRVNVLSFGSLEDFAEGIRWDTKDNVVRVESAIRKEPNRTIGDHWVRYLVVVTALMRGGNTAVCLLEVGGCWDFDRRHGQSHHSHNLDRAQQMVKVYLSSQGYTVAHGIWDSRAVMDNGFLATTDLWTFHDHDLIPKAHMPSVKVPFGFTDKGENSAGRRITGEVEIGDDGISIRFDGYGTFDCEGDKGPPVYIESYNGELRVLLWPDINNENPIITSMEEARVGKYRD